MSSMLNMSLNEFLDLTASDAPAPGGGSVAALAAALGSALGKMVLDLSYGKKSYEALDPEIKAKMEEADGKLVNLRREFSKLIDKDTDAFMGFMAALKMPKDTEEEKAARKDAMDKAAVNSMLIPLQTAELCLELARCLPNVAAYGNKNAVTDAGVASLLSRAACEAAIFNVKINLSSVADEALCKDAEERCEKALSEIEEINTKIVATVYKRI